MPEPIGYSSGASESPEVSSRVRTALFSIVSPNYRAFARVLMASAKRHQPDWDRFVLFVDSGSDFTLPAGEPFTAVPLADLALPNRQQFCFKYTILELNTAVKPWMFEHLFAKGYDRVVYLDPDIAIFSPLVELDGGPAETFLTLTPHLTGPIGGDDHPSERSILQAGTYNLGFLAARRQPSLGAFLSWWQDRLEHQCVVEIERGLFVDQKWIDLAPGLFPGVSVLRHEGYNVAYWNLAQRTVKTDGRGYSVNGQPLRFFHFSGYDPGLTGRVSKHHHSLRLVDVGDAREVIDAYGDALLASGYDEFRGLPYGYGFFSNGARVSDTARHAYRNSPDLRAEAGENPFEHPELFSGYRDARRRASFVARAGLASYQMLSKARPLVKLLPEPIRRSMRETLLGRKEQGPGSPVRGKTSSRGLTVVGYLSRNTGVGESARLCAAACEAAGLTTQSIDVDASDAAELGTVHAATIFHVNADQAPVIRGALPRIFAADTYRIGCWHWELSELPDEWIESAVGLDEIWAPSSFVQSTLSRKLTIPVVHMPHGVAVKEIEQCSPQEFGVPQRQFTMLCMFDLASVPERKNPGAAIEAFRRAFPTRTAAALLVKVNQSESHPDELRALQETLRDIPGVYLTDSVLPRARVNGLIAACDGVISLHRSEGFGLILAEAMCLGKPVVATGWSGNMDFMNVSNSCVVGYELVTLDRDHGPYRAGQTWAEPDIDHAASLLRRLAEDAAFRARIGASAAATIGSQFSPVAAGLRYAARLKRVGADARS
ncbi:MAG: glycosyltransferase [Acidobacteria bacterium]|nr:glycosyltransferase [Acidobacteriota bacterium]